MGYLYAVLVVITIACLWYRARNNLKAQGRGWFMQHWLGISIGCFAGLMQALMFSSDSMVWNGIGAAVTLAAVSLARSPLPSPSK